MICQVQEGFSSHPRENTEHPLGVPGGSRTRTQRLSPGLLEAGSVLLLIILAGPSHAICGSHMQASQQDLDIFALLPALSVMGNRNMSHV